MSTPEPTRPDPSIPDLGYIQLPSLNHKRVIRRHWPLVRRLLRIERRRGVQD